VADATGKKVGADVCLFDVGPNVGALNRAIILQCDFFITPVAPDLFSLRALSTVGRSVAKWMKDWATIRKLASAADKARLPHGKPAYMGYITSAYKVKTGKRATDPHADWEKRIAPRVRDRIIEVIKAIDPKLVPQNGNKLGQIKAHRTAASLLKKGLFPAALGARKAA
jgi:hypothetical protein